jgi:hypothetical protein
MDWDETPVNKYLPEFELKDPILTSQLTLADMLSHRTVRPLTPIVPLLSVVLAKQISTCMRLIHFFLFFFFFFFFGHRHPK